MSEDSRAAQQSGPITALDVLAQCTIALQETATAMLAAIELVKQSGSLTSQQSQSLSERELAALEKIGNLGKKSRAVFMQDKKQQQQPSTE